MLVVHVPHASMRIPRSVRNQFILSPEELFDEVMDSVDLCTDDLARSAFPEAEIVEADVSRIVVDVERFADDSMETMSSVGRGMIYTHTVDGYPLRRELSHEERRDLKARWYDPHWFKLKALAKGSVLIDLHSYPTDPWNVELNKSERRPEIDLGVSAGVTPPDWAAAVSHHFEAAGFDVGINVPYAGVIDAGADAAIMIEIRRDVLMYGADDEKFKRISDCLSSMPLA